MVRSETMDYEISFRVGNKQLKFLEERARELGVSKEELVQLYIKEAIDAKSAGSQFSLEGLCKEGLPVTDEDIDEVIREWNKIE
jgi:hypothetical protein